MFLQILRLYIFRSYIFTSYAPGSYIFTSYIFRSYVCRSYTIIDSTNYICEFKIIKEFKNPYGPIDSHMVDF